MPLLQMGHVAPDEVPYWINAANAVLVPSQAEGFGLSVIEAIACGVPAFGTPVGIHPVALDGIEGALLRAVGPRRVARGARARTSRRADPRVDGRRRAELFSADRMAARVVAAWRGLLEERAAALGAPRVDCHVAAAATLYSNSRGASSDAPRPPMNGLLRRLTRRRAATADENPPGTPAASEPVDATVVSHRGGRLRPVRGGARARGGAQAPPPRPARRARPRRSSRRPSARAPAAGRLRRRVRYLPAAPRGAAARPRRLLPTRSTAPPAARRTPAQREILETQGRAARRRSTRSCASSRRRLGEAPTADDRRARARHRRHLPRVRRAARQRRGLVLRTAARR